MEIANVELKLVNMQEEEIFPANLFKNTSPGARQCMLCSCDSRETIESCRAYFLKDI